ncbi:Signal transduction histidine kinase [Asanoa ishikariensis]|uniref:histidine kinase n=1 Tax=Asanoa ishikariensis TaxID=137265 RepID=A0A1H3U8S9_9ACTN|nr:Signal transduction histidine kinase [Asanoa ishikariensis]
MPRHLLADAALALALLAVTLGPNFVTALASPQKPGDSVGFLARAGVPLDYIWWLCAALAIVGVALRRRNAVVALVLTAAGTAGHLLLQTKFQLLDLALPLVLYTLAAMSRRRRFVLGALAVTMILTYLAMLGSRVDMAHNQKAAAAAKQAQQALDGQEPTTPQRQPDETRMLANTAIPVGALVETGQAVLEMWLLLVAAYAVGDGIRTRRAHLVAIEQRTADLARQERQRATLAVAAERTRITRELHDVVAHGMSVMVVQAQGAAAALDRHPDRAATALQHVIEVGRSSLSEMRRLLTAERTDPAGEDARLAPLPGIGAIPDLVDQLRSAGMRIDLRIEGVPDVLPAAVDLSAYRIVQEALTNTLKHAGPDAGAWVRLEFDPEFLRVDVTDDGQGLAEGADGSGNGLRGIAERVAMLGGTLETGRAPDRGFRLGATLPVGARP